MGGLAYFAQRGRVSRMAAVALLWGVVFTLMLSSNPDRALAVSMTQDQAIAWCQGRVGKTSGDGQCVAFIKDYYQALGVAPVSGNGSDYTWNALPDGWTRVQGGQPQKGDILVYTGGYGHVAVYESDRVTYHQNFDNVKYVQRITYAYNALNNPYWGYIRPDFNRPPVGIFASCEGGSDNTLRVCGWAYDPDVPNEAISIHVYVGGPAGSGASCYTKDAVGNNLLANYQFRSQGKSEFDYTLRVNEAGVQPIYVYAINNVPYTDNPELSGSGMTAIICVGGKGQATTTLPNGRYTVRSKLKPTSGFDVLGASQDKQTPIVLYTWNGTTNQQFDFSVQDDSSYMMNVVHSGQAIEIYGASTDACVVPSTQRSHGGVAQRWWLEPNDDGTWSIRHRVSGMYLDLKRNNTDDYTGIQQFPYHGEDNQRWYIVPVNVSAWNVSVPEMSTTPEPNPTVMAGGLELVEGVDYEVTYEDNEQAGTAKAIVTGKGGFTGSKAVTFQFAGYDEDGWVDLSGGRKGYRRGGSLAIGWLTLGGDKYYFGEGGAAAEGWREIGGQTYYFRPGDYRMASGWATIGGSKVLFRSDGRLADGWVTLSGAKYYADAGAPREGWQEIGGTRYYFREDGTYRMASGWATIGGGKVLFRSDGRLAEGWVTLDGASYYADQGAPREGWQDLAGGRRYFRPAPDHRMAVGWATIDGVAYQFDDLGRLVG